MRYLLDTNSWVDHLRHGPTSKVTARLTALPCGSVALCSIVLGELLYGVYQSAPAHQAANLALVARLRQQFASVPLDDRAAEEYGKLRAHLPTMGTLIGPNDLLIAAIALANGFTLVTHNLREFSRVKLPPPARPLHRLLRHRGGRGPPPQSRDPFWRVWTMAYDDSLPGYNTYSRCQIFHLKDSENNEATVQVNWLERSAKRDMEVHGSDRDGSYASGKVVDGTLVQGTWRCDRAGGSGRATPPGKISSPT